jgi:alkylation response protein AidB-like acyl-CoA dehydrogenase
MRRLTTYGYRQRTTDDRRLNMDFQLSEEHNMMRASVKQMLSKYEHRKKEWREMTHRDHKFNYELWNEFANLGLFGCRCHGGTDIVRADAGVRGLRAGSRRPDAGTCMARRILATAARDEARIIPGVVREDDPCSR